jgi:hypothetical protein
LRSELSAIRGIFIRQPAQCSCGAVSEDVYRLSFVDEDATPGPQSAVPAASLRAPVGITYTQSNSRPPQEIFS